MKKKVPLSFEHAMVRAASYLGHKERLRGLLEVTSNKSQRCYESLLVSWETLQIFIRMLRAWASGSYSAPADSILMIVAAVIYFVSPFDIIPDGIPVFGLMDDVAVIACVAKANLTAISNFRDWETRVSA